MSKNATITEGKQGRTFDGTERLETEQPDGNSCFWVPEDERQLDVKYVMENGDHYPDNYAMSEINVNVIDKITDLDGEDWEITIDDIGIPHIILPDLDIDITIDPEDGLPEINIDGVDIDLPEIDGLLDLDEDIDISIDDMDLDITGLDLDGLDLDVRIDLGTLDIDLFDLPDEIRIIHLPDKAEYKEKEKIDFKGLVVQAYRNGEVWEDKDGKYQDGYIPEQELTFSTHTAKQVGRYYYDHTTGKTYTLYEELGHSYFLNYEWDYQYESWYFYDRFLEYGATATYKAKNGYFVITTDYGFGYCFGKTEDIACDVTKTSGGKNGNYNPPRTEDAEHHYHFDSNHVGYLDGDETKPYYWTGIFSNLMHGEHSSSDYLAPSYLVKHYSDYHDYKILSENQGKRFDYDSIPNLPDNSEIFGRMLYGATNGDKITVFWSRPKDNKILKASFNITVEEDTGSHHSGTWGNDESGHWGGTTIGEDGGSHHSGKF